MMFFIKSFVVSDIICIADGWRNKIKDVQNFSNVFALCVDCYFYTSSIVIIHNRVVSQYCLAVLFFRIT